MYSSHLNREVKCHLILPYSTIGPYLTINPPFLVPMYSSHPNGSFHDLIFNWTTLHSSFHDFIQSYHPSTALHRTPVSYQPSTALRRTSSSTFLLVLLPGQLYNSILGPTKSVLTTLHSSFHDFIFNWSTLQLYIGLLGPTNLYGSTLYIGFLGSTNFYGSTACPQNRLIFPTFGSSTI